MQKSRLAAAMRVFVKTARQGIQSPYALDQGMPAAPFQIGGNIFFDGVFKGDYSLAIVNRYLARSLVKKGLQLTLYTTEEGWLSDSMLNEMPDVRSRFASSYPLRQSFDIHLRNTWPPKADDMIGRRINAYVCFAWEEMELPRNIVDHFNNYLDLVMVTSNFVHKALLHSGVKIPVAVVGNGTDHVMDVATSSNLRAADPSCQRVLHVSSCFPRKGADLLVQAFNQTFSASDNVELYIKTFDNPHNTIDQDAEIARQAQPSTARIEIVKKSMSYPELVALMRSSDLLVAPSRGEGFGLPLAEAMLLNVPIVTTGYSGQTDFCTDETAWLVDYKMVPSSAHVAKEGALWAEPSLVSLGSQMKRALSSRAASRAKLERGQELLKAHFKWSDVARRVCQAIDRASRTRFATGVSAMKIDLVSTWEQICGIAQYSQHLFATPALKPTLARVLARELRSDGIVSDTGPPVTRPWGYEAAGIRRLEASLMSGNGDIAWIQHHPAFFSDHDMDDIVAATQRSTYSLKVVTLHNVRETLADKRAAWLKLFDIIIVHTQQDAELLTERGCVAAIIPHGILAEKVPPRPRVDTFTVGTFGFLYPHKNVPLLVQAFALAKTAQPHLRLKLLNCTRNDPVSHKERVRVEALVEALGLQDTVDLDFGFLRDEEIILRLGQCDLLCFPYGESSESATGAARIALAADRPLLCSQSSVLRDIHPVSLILPRIDAGVLADAIVTLSASPAICTLRDAQRKAYVDRHAYPAIGERHLKLLTSHLKDKE